MAAGRAGAATCTIGWKTQADGVTFTDFTGPQVAATNGVFSANAALKYIRDYLITLTGGTNPAVTLGYAGVRVH